MTCARNTTRRLARKAWQDIELSGTSQPVRRTFCNRLPDDLQARLLLRVIFYTSNARQPRPLCTR